MPTRTRYSLTRAIQKIVRQSMQKKYEFSEKSDFSMKPIAASPALLSLVLLSQPALAQDRFNTQFVEVPRLENPLKPPIDVGSNSKPTFADIDNDGDMDVFIGAFNGTVKYYENTGTVSNPIFDERIAQNNPLNSVAGGYSSSPTLVDIDSDEDLDAFIGGKGGTVKYYENTGTASQPTFVERTEQQNPFNGVDINGDTPPFGSSVPFFVDIDGDGDLDAFIGASDGTVKYYENTGTASQPTFVEHTEQQNPFNGVDVDDDSVPYFADIDNDSDFDAFIGGSVDIRDDDGQIISTYGTVRYYENTGSASRPVFKERTDTANPLHGVDVGNNSAPTLIDIDNDSDLDAFIGASDGMVKYYENTGTRNDSHFVERAQLDNPFGGGIVDAETTIALADIDNDGDLDAFTGTSDGSVKYYENTGNVNQPHFVERTEQNNPLNDVKMDSDSRPTLVDIDNDGDMDAFVGGQIEVRDEDGDTNTDYTIKYYENTGRATRPVFYKRTEETTNPLSDVEVSRVPNLRFVDIDSDKDLDLISHASSTIMYYENIGSVSRPHFVKRTGQKNPFANMKAERLPAIVDLNNDGVLEAFITADGTVKYYKYKNTDLPEFFEQTDEQNNPFADVKVDNGIPTLVDMDNDGDLDAFISAGTTKYYQNTSKVNQQAFGYFNIFKAVPVSQPTLVDIDGDGDLDAFFRALNYSVIYYENNGTASQPIFEERTGQNNPLADVKVGIIGSQPTLIDIDGDDDLDAFIVDWDTIRYYENRGTVNKPSFVERTTEQNNPLANVDVSSSNSSVSLVDIDNDSDLDAFIITNGKVSYYENTGTASQPNFVKPPKQNNPLMSVEVYYGSTLAWVDFDNDTDWDVFINVSDSVRYYENQGTPSLPDFVERTEQNNPFAEVDIPSDNDPTFVDIDGDGDWDAFIGEGMVRYYENTGTLSEPEFVQRTKQDNPLASANVLLTKPSLVDIDNDSDLDAFIGTNYGTVKYYENVGTVNHPFFEERTEHPLAKVDVEFDSHPTLVDIDGDNDWDAFIGAKDGTVRYYENTGTVISQPRFDERTGPNNPLAEVQVESNSQPTLIDFDQDGDLDAFIRGRMVVRGETGEEVIYTVKFYQNIGSGSEPRFVDHTEQNSLLAQINTESFTFIDIDGDDDLDAAVVIHDEVHYGLIMPTNYYENYYENTGHVDGMPVFVKLSAEQNENYKADEVFRDNPTLADIDNDGDMDAFIGGGMYNENRRLASNALPNPYALPKGGFYNSKREVSLNCIDCEKIYYTLEGSTPTTASTEYVAPVEITQNTTLKFAALDAQGNLGKVRAEQYVIDTTLPEITINSPTNNSTIEGMVSIEGNASAPEDVTGLDRIELQITDGNYYLTNDNNNPYTTSLTWIPLSSANNWFYDINTELFPVGTYSITARAFDRAGNVAEDTLTVKNGLAFTTLSMSVNSSAILPNATVEVAGKLTRFPYVETDLSNLPIILTITSPDGSRWQDSTVTNHLGQYQFHEISGFSQKGTYRFEAAFEGTDRLEVSRSQPDELLVGTSAGYAILIQGKVKNEEGLKPHHKTLNRVYKQLQARGFLAENILNFNYDATQTFNDPVNPSPDNQYIPTKAGIQQAIEKWAKNRLLGSPAPLYLIMVDHGNPEQFILNEETISPEDDLNNWLNTLEQSLAGTELNPLDEKRFVIIGACYSGSFIPKLSKPGRVIITSASSNEVSYKGPQEKDGIRSGEYFIEALFQQLGRGEPIKAAFEHATESTERFTDRGSASANNLYNPELLDNAAQHPLLDDNGDGKGSNVLYTGASADGQQIKKAILGAGLDYDINSVGNPATVKAVTESQYLGPNDSSALLWLRTSGQVENAVMEIRRPVSIDNLTLQPLRTEQVELDLPIRFPSLRDNGRYEYTYEDFKEPGQYHIFYYVHDQLTMKLDPETGDILSSGDISPLKRSVVYKNKPNNQPPNSFKLLYPTDGASTRTALRFDWETTTDQDGDAVTYTFVIATDQENFDNSVVYKQEERPIPVTTIDNNTVINDGRTDGTTGLKDLTTYYWKVEAIDNFGARTTSPVFAFHTDNFENGGFNPIDNNCDSTLENNNHCATVSSDVQGLHIPAANAFELGWYKGDLHQTASNIFTVTNLELIPPVQRPTGNETRYYPATGELLIRTVEIELNGIKYEYRATMRLIPNTDPLQFQFINEEIIPLWNR